MMIKPIFVHKLGAVEAGKSLGFLNLFPPSRQEIGNLHAQTNIAHRGCEARE